MRRVREETAMLDGIGDPVCDAALLRERGPMPEGPQDKRPEAEKFELDMDPEAVEFRKEIRLHPNFEVIRKTDDIRRRHICSNNSEAECRSSWARDAWKLDMDDREPCLPFDPEIAAEVVRLNFKKRFSRAEMREIRRKTEPGPEEIARGPLEMRAPYVLEEEAEEMPTPAREEPKFPKEDLVTSVAWCPIFRAFCARETCAVFSPDLCRATGRAHYRAEVYRTLDPWTGTERGRTARILRPDGKAEEDFGRIV